MATSAFDERRALGAGGTRARSLARALAIDATIPAVLFASATIIIGLHWDIAWHRTIGRDTFWSPPHVMEQIAASVAGLFCGWRVLYTSFMGTDADRAGAVRWWGKFYGPLGAWVCIWGTIAMISSAPFDNWWHNAYGLDVKILTPPHVFLLSGMMSVQLGAMLMMLAHQNVESASVSSRRGLLFGTSMGLIVLMFATAVFEYTGVPNYAHSPLYYQICAGLFPIFLVAVARAGRVRLPATVAATTYSVVMLVLSWILALVPATPKLAPIYNQLTALVPPGFPILLIVPALAIDSVLSRLRSRNDWLLAGLCGVSFVAVLLLVQWPMASFLLSLEQPNYLFATGYWDYGARLGSWTTTFFDVPGYQWVAGKGPQGALDVAAMARGIGIAMVLGVASSRVGLWWGDWMRRVQR